MTKANECTCPSGDGSLRHPCPAHPASVELAGVAANLTFINGRPAMCGCQVEYSSGGGEYSDVIYVTLCAKHSGSAILDLVATNRIALTPEYEGQWHADLYLDREIPLAKAEGATPAEAVLALMSAERIDPEQGGVDQAGGDRWDALQSIMEWTAAENIPDDRKLCLIRNAARAALAQPSPVRSSLLINGYQLRAALEFIAPDGTAKQLESEARIEWRQQDADFLEAGLYAWCAEYPEEGCVLLDEEPATAQPSPAQAEQAEAERPEAVAWQYRVTAGPQTGWSLWHPGKGEEFERSYTVERRPLMTVAQYDRIVGELRAVIAQLRQHKNDYMDSGQETYRALQNEIREREAEIARLDGLVSGRTAERDAALARVAELERQEPVSTEHLPMHIAYARAKREVFLGSCQEDVFRFALIDLLQEFPLYAAPVAQAQHSVPELLEWAVDRWHAEVSLRPLINVHRRALDDTWRQVIRHLGGDTGLLCGPSHDELLAAAPGKEVGHE